MARTIVVTLEKGKAMVETSGFKGESCLAATAPLEAMIGKVDQRDMKSEAYETPEQERETEFA